MNNLLKCALEPFFIFVTAKLMGGLNEPPQPRGAARRSLAGFIEIPQFRRRLVGLGGHQVAVRAHHVGLVADHHVRVVLGTVDGNPVRPQARRGLGRHWFQD